METSFTECPHLLRTARRVSVTAVVICRQGRFGLKDPLTGTFSLYSPRVFPSGFAIPLQKSMALPFLKPGSDFILCVLVDSGTDPSIVSPSPSCSSEPVPTRSAFAREHPRRRRVAGAHAHTHTHAHAHWPVGGRGRGGAREAARLRGASGRHVRRASGRAAVLPELLRLGSVEVETPVGDGAPGASPAGVPIPAPQSPRPPAQTTVRAPSAPTSPGPPGAKRGDVVGTRLPCGRGGFTWLSPQEP